MDFSTLSKPNGDFIKLTLDKLKSLNLDEYEDYDTPVRHKLNLIKYDFLDFKLLVTHGAEFQKLNLVWERNII
jgi:hypothetical protein